MTLVETKTKRIPLKQITITRAEGPIYKCVTKTHKTFISAKSHLYDAVYDQKGRGGGYDKHDVTVEWEDGYSYSYRADVSSDGTDTDVGSYLAYAWRFYAGKRCPSHMEQEHYDRMLESHKKIEGWHPEDFETRLKTYALHEW